MRVGADVGAITRDLETSWQALLCALCDLSLRPLRPFFAPFAVKVFSQTTEFLLVTHEGGATHSKLETLKLETSFAALLCALCG
jgi:hypothetical protein